MLPVDPAMGLVVQEERLDCYVRVQQRRVARQRLHLGTPPEVALPPVTIRAFALVVLLERQLYLVPPVSSAFQDTPTAHLTGLPSYAPRVTERHLVQHPIAGIVAAGCPQPPQLTLASFAFHARLGKATMSASTRIVAIAAKPQTAPIRAG